MDNHLKKNSSAIKKFHQSWLVTNKVSTHIPVVLMWDCLPIWTWFLRELKEILRFLPTVILNTIVFF